MADPQFDQAKADAFSQKMLGILNDASVAQMIVIGHQVGLFDTLAGLTPSTSEQIAAAGALNERYVREWLGAMVTSRIVDYDPAERKPIACHPNMPLPSRERLAPRTSP